MKQGSSPIAKEQALERIGDLNIDLDLLRAFSPAADKLGKSLGEFETYIRNNIEFIPNFGERYRQGETISTAFVESRITQVVSKRFVKKQQMQWTPRGADLLLQTRTKSLTTISRASSAVGIHSFALVPLDPPRLLDALLFLRVFQVSPSWTKTQEQWPSACILPPPIFDKFHSIFRSHVPYCQPYLPDRP
jgi:hypothetical protein